MSDTIVNPDPPVDPPAPPPMDATFARASAQATLAPVGQALDQAVAAAVRAKPTAESWTDEFWGLCGYDKEMVLEALDQLEKLAGIYAGEAGLAGTHAFAADASVLQTQAPAG